ncbi:Predicted dehydrogenase [Cribrihabitans marinus]|uniref:Predicted dehydrogenase n=1 Tax=Cribrihabitans marinus TaxID=1227549 RepID=A0A1H6SZ17_9RHOB|nr:NAD-dependent epimerase/dehydratase family protein [Cribrihabitans marinus]GGH23106.1 hypothetical protein GCM10010973_08820 [Cribrihabitans marinus]SEI69280.1 Predicted dehydrogenase [Cribrihabitans marinus]
MTDTAIRIGLIGAGYIAGWHADAITATDGLDLTAICDRAPGAAQALAERHGARAFDDTDELLASGLCDAVHVLTPPDSHAELAIRCLQTGHHVLVEKPVALSATEAARIEAAAQAADRRFHCGHNFLGLPSYERLRKQLADGALGRISGAEIRWCYPLPPLRSGPFSLWLLREPRHLALEFGPHLMAFANDLFGPVEVEHVSLGKPITLPGGVDLPQSWRITARAGDVDLTLILSLVETVDDRSLTLRGSTASARLDLAADTLVIDAENASDLVVNPARRQAALAWQHLRNGAAKAAVQLVSLNRKSPYPLSFRGMMNGIYGPLRADAAPDSRFAGATAEPVMGALDQLIAKAGLPGATPPRKAARKPDPDALVIGGTGFIGRALTRELVARGRDVRVLSRGKTGPFADLPEQVETVAVDLRDSDGLARAMAGIDTVWNLARSVDDSWEDCLANDVAVTERIGRAALSAGVRRLIYTGTIASYDMSDPDEVITEATGFAEDMSDRNLYARSKAECERRLLALHRTKGLPVTIARPGIVLGRGGPLQHWGIGRWHGAGAVRIWGDGRNPLPFVLIEDCVDALIRMGEADGIEGESFNLVAPPMLGAQAYFDAIEDRLRARIRVSRGNLRLLFAADAVKHALKTRVLRREGLTRPSLRDWLSRAHLSRFDSTFAQDRLGWQPVTDRETFLRKAIDEANLLGF